ncbi:hypothetical protein PR048_026341 [Dryococelus australis]|uniref:Glucose-methanol-choline oxidoreductase N-terminal domain-containing protein n=1 Tax=Dryococelus australis TaxID=614101 RepID=A0ABQ9GL46_9NEOP|nr:hypothetical protein PR048_026341 [Dryococelus australis]
MQCEGFRDRRWGNGRTCTGKSAHGEKELGFPPRRGGWRTTRVVAHPCFDWQFRTVPPPHYCGGAACSYRSGKYHGGSSATPTMMYTRGSKRDYDKLERLGNKGCGYKDVLKFFLKSERNGDPHLASTKYHNSTRPFSINYFRYQDINTMAILQALKEFGLPGIDVDGDHLIGAAITQTSTAQGER